MKEIDVACLCEVFVIQSRVLREELLTAAQEVLVEVKGGGGESFFDILFKGAVVFGPEERETGVVESFPQLADLWYPMCPCEIGYEYGDDENE